MKRTRTSIPPLFGGVIPGRTATWSWVVTVKIRPNGYPSECHVIATRSDIGEVIQGSASGEVPPFVDLHEVMELLATEAMIAATEPTLWDHVPHRLVDVSSSL